MAWKSVAARMRVQFVVYADIEAITPKITYTSNQLHARKVEKQILCGIHAICLNEKGKLMKQYSSRSEGCVTGFLDTVRNWAKEIYRDKR